MIYPSLFLILSKREGGMGKPFATRLALKAHDFSRIAAAKVASIANN